MFDDLSASSRISPVDSPQPSTPTRKLSASFMRPTGPSSTMRLSSSLTGKNRSKSPPMALTTPSPSSEDENGSDDSPASPSDSLVLRSRFPSPTLRTSFSPNRRRSFLNPQSISLTSRALTHLYRPYSQRTTKLILFILKVVSLNAICSPMATRPSYLYALLALASLDAILNDGRRTGFMVTVFLAILHVALLIGLQRAEVLCVSWRSVESF